SPDRIRVSGGHCAAGCRGFRGRTEGLGDRSQGPLPSLELRPPAASPPAVGTGRQCVDKPLIGAILRAPRSPGREAARVAGLWAFIYGVWVRLTAMLRALFPKPQALSGAL